MGEREAFQRAVDQFSDWRWRLNNLYWITDKDGRKTQFRMNWAQEALFNGMHYQNVILKARQIGFTTFIQIFMLDAAVFNSNIRAGTIAHTLNDAQVIFRDKVKYPYESLPDQIRAAVPVVKDSAMELMLANNSSIRVGTSLRSGTLQYLHVSEYGKLCAKYPEKAREVRTGALNTIDAGQVVFIESTAEGQEGHFYDLTQSARSKERAGSVLTALDFKFHFFAWWQNPGYEIDPVGVPIPEEYARYFDKLRDEQGIDLSARKRAWYVKKAETQASDMKREYPSTPDEAFEASIEGAYYADQLAATELQRRIGAFPAVDGIPIESAWDIGVGDYTSIWLFQRVRSRYRMVGYIQNCGEGMAWYIAEMDRLARERKWTLGTPYWPHDGKVREWGSGKSRYEQFNELVKSWPVIVPAIGVDDGIAAVRRIFSLCDFDEEACSEGLKALRAYRKEWDEERGIWKDKPRHDWASHGADAFRTMATRFRDVELKPELPQRPSHLVYEAKADGSIVANMSIRDIVEAKRKRREQR